MPIYESASFNISIIPQKTAPPSDPQASSEDPSRLTQQKNVSNIIKIYFIVHLGNRRMKAIGQNPHIRNRTIGFRHHQRDQLVPLGRFLFVPGAALDIPLSVLWLEHQRRCGERRLSCAADVQWGSHIPGASV